MSVGSRARAVRITCCSSGCPANGCSTFGKSEFIRLPWPAARMTTERCCMKTSFAEVLAFLAQTLDSPQLCHGAEEFRLRFRDVDFIGAIAHRILGALFRRQGGGFVQVPRPRRGIREHGHQMRLHFERAASDVEGLLFLAFGLHAD